MLQTVTTIRWNPQGIILHMQCELKINIYPKVTEEKNVMERRKNSFNKMIEKITFYSQFYKHVL